VLIFLLENSFAISFPIPRLAPVIRAYSLNEFINNLKNKDCGKDSFLVEFLKIKKPEIGSGFQHAGYYLLN